MHGAWRYLNSVPWKQNVMVAVDRNVSFACEDKVKLASGLVKVRRLVPVGRHPLFDYV